MEMIETLPFDQVCIPVTESSQPAAARRAAVALAQDAGLDERAVGTVSLVVTELATNLVKHAKGGELLMRRLGSEGTEGIEVLSLDKGPGISNVALSPEMAIRRREVRELAWALSCALRGHSTCTRSRARAPLWSHGCMANAGKGRHMHNHSASSVKLKEAKRSAATAG
jgi:hypothetical protein